MTSNYKSDIIFLKNLEKMMEVILNHYTPLIICSNAIRTCWQSFDKSDNGGQKDKELIDRVGNKFKHSSTLELWIFLLCKNYTQDALELKSA
jgi:thymidylate synthase ThyX